MRIFGPVPSRRLGQSLGLNHIPPKTCTYSCIYCQVGRTNRMTLERQAFYDPHELIYEVEQVVERLKEKEEKVDYLTFVPDGEPTLDINLGLMAELLKPLGIPLAVISNGSLAWREDVRDDLMKFDWVSLKVDSIHKEAWKDTDRPHGKLDLKRIMKGYLEFHEKYENILCTETMLVRKCNDSEESLRETAAFLADLKPDIAYISIPTRPPAEKGVEPADEKALNRAFHLFSEKVNKVELLIGFEGNEFSSSGDAAKDILSITAVHPMRKDQVDKLLKDCGEDWNTVKKLVSEGKILEIPYREKYFYLRSIGTDRK
ncbi:MAG: radical SAM protein [Synergistales bacterium]|nr:radical SAM protein [Synergistales bacterium]